MATASGSTSCDFLVAFVGLARGLLWTPVHGVQQAADVIGVITNAKSALDMLGHAGTGPQIGRESGCLRSLEQLFLQLLALARREFQRPSAGGKRFESGPAAEAQGVLPAAHAARIDIQTARDFSLRQPLAEQIGGALALALQLFGSALRPDRSPPKNKNSIGLYFCRTQ